MNKKELEEFKSLLRKMWRNSHKCAEFYDGKDEMMYRISMSRARAINEILMLLEDKEFYKDIKSIFDRE